LPEKNEKKPVVKKEKNSVENEDWAFNLSKKLNKKPEKKVIESKPFSTIIDELMSLLEKKEVLSVGELSKKSSINKDSVEAIGKLLERQQIVDVIYPATMLQDPRIALRKKLSSQKVFKKEGNVFEQYSFVADMIPASVRILKSPVDRRPFYELNVPCFGPYTMAFLEELKNEIAEKVPIEAGEITDSKKSEEIKKRFFAVARKELEQYLKENASGLDLLAGTLLHSMYGLGIIEVLMKDDFLEEVALNSANEPITVYHRKYGWLKTNQTLSGEEDISNYASQIGRKVGREITTLKPILDAHLSSGDRVNATLFPISTSGNTITIRRFARRPWTVVDFVGESHTMSIEMSALLWLAMQYEMSVIVAGGTASGKTSALNALSAFIPSYHRIISIEDVREIMLPDYMKWNWVPLTTRNPNPEGMGEVSMLDLLHSSLRMRPDRIILGEMRRKREAEVLFEAMHTGHSVYSTIHADSGRQVLQRLTEPPIDLPPLEVEALNLLVVQYRDRRTNVRRTYEIAEIESGLSGEQLSVNTIYRWKPKEDSWDKANEPTKLINTINLHTGLTSKEISEEIFNRANVLAWMLDNKLNGINEVGNVMKFFYSEPDELIKEVEKGTLPSKLFGR
jgi:archaeal flagellar protein FlaI